tara:strand:- start:847 stop:5067 length:4221 start_codon:yes stop_codon:yes gene_type:complete
VESPRRFGGSRALLPYEAELCNVLGISKDEYLQFLDLVQAKIEGKKRGYELIPDIRADAVTAFFLTGTGTLTFAGQIAVSLILAGVSYLLTPKPKTPDAAENLKLGDIQGKSRFGPQSGFDSIQDLAVLGSFIPLVYASKGVRVNSQLLWSQIRTTGKGQTISAIVLFSNGKLGAIPDYSSYALGSTLLDNISPHKVALYFSDGGEAESVDNRLNANNKYSESKASEENVYGNRGFVSYDTNDPFAIKEHSGVSSNVEEQSEFKPYFSSTRTSETKAQFGLYSTLPNGNAYKVPWELVQFMKDADGSSKEDLYKKLQKINHKYPQYCHVKGTTTEMNSGTIKRLEEGSEFTYTLYSSADEDAWTQASGVADLKYNKFSPWGSVDAKNSVDQIREMVDSNMSIGDQYLIGSAIVTCKSVDNANVWQNSGISEGATFSKNWTLEIEEAGDIKYSRHKSTGNPFDSFNLSKLAIASVNNLRVTRITEIGIKSRVFKQISGFQNVNALPSKSRIEYYSSKNTSMSLGSVSGYISRISCFVLEMRPVDTDMEFENVLGNVVLGIKGSTPTDQYNTLIIDSKHNPAKYEYRFRPISGNHLLSISTRNGRNLYILDHASPRVAKTYSFTNTKTESYSANLRITVYFHGYLLTLPFNLDRDSGAPPRTSNQQWVKGSQGAEITATGQQSIGSGPTVPVGGPVKGLSVSSSGTMPESNEDWTNSQPLAAFSKFIIKDAVTSGIFYGAVYPANGSQYDRLPVNPPGGNFNNWNLFVPQVGVVQTVFGGQNYRFYLPAGWLPEGMDYIELNVSQADRFDTWTDPVINPAKSNKFFRYKMVDADVHVNTSCNKQEIAFRNNRFYYAFRAEANMGDEPPTVTTTSNSVGSGLSVTSNAGAGVSIKLTTTTNTVDTYYEWEIESGGDGYFTGDTLSFTGNANIAPFTVIAADKPVIDTEPEDPSDGDENWKTNVYKSYWDLKYLNPHDILSDYSLYDAESSSHDNGPEHTISFINEITKPLEDIQYTNLAIAGIRINSAKEFNSFNQLSAFVKKGIEVTQLIDDSGSTTETSTKKSSNNFVEIAYDLLTNETYGVGSLVGVSGVNKELMQEAARYCHANNFTWDGIIDGSTNLREFIFTHAGYNFLDFSIVGGLFALRPSFPTKASGQIDSNATTDSGIKINALYTDGNMRNLQVSFLTPEERQSFKATVLYRKQEENGFPETKAVTIALASENIDSLPEEVFDLSGWCTSLSHAKRFAAIALAMRKDIDHGISFETTPTSVLGLLAGDYIRVISENTHSSRFNNGSIDADGVVVSRSEISGTINIYYWSPGTLGNVESGTLTVGSDGKATTGLRNVLFAQVDTTEENRIYKVNSITYGEEGFVQIGASHVPLTTDKTIKVLEDTNPSEASFETKFSIAS